MALQENTSLQAGSSKSKDTAEGNETACSNTAFLGGKLNCIFDKLCRSISRIGMVLSLVFAALSVSNYFFAVAPASDLIDMGVYHMKPHEITVDWTGRPVIVIYKAEEGAPYALSKNFLTEARAREELAHGTGFTKRFLEGLKYDSVLLPVEPDMTPEDCENSARTRYLLNIVIAIMMFVILLMIQRRFLKSSNPN